MNLKSQTIYAVIIAGLFFITGIYLVTSTWVNVNRTNQNITVIGSAKKEIVSDIGILRGTLQLQSESIKQGYNDIQSQMPLVIAYLTNKGIKNTQIEIFPISSFANYEFTAQGFQTGRINSYTVSQRFQVKLTDVTAIKSLSLSIGELNQKNLPLQMDAPEYYYSKLADLKIEIQAEAAKDAQQRAARIAAATGQQLGPMRMAKMGVLQITPRNSNMVGDYGINDVSSIEKEITAVVHAGFEID
ncbi:MAG: SIMPL domain-containing protein [Bacteroidia bacterium]|jgi:hypothetical protein|nr:SIMPL domain-containing protein [Bacteroidia bacterium]